MIERKFCLNTLCYLCGLMGHIDENCKKLLLLGEDNGYREWSQDLRADPRNPTTTEDAKYLRDSDHGGSDESKT